MTGGGNWPTLTTTGKTLHTEGHPDLHIPRVEEDRLANLLWHLRFASDQTDQRSLSLGFGQFRLDRAPVCTPAEEPAGEKGS